MKTQKHNRAEQARINGAKSYGASTPDGIQKCRLASVKHGAYIAASAILPGEDPKQYKGLYDSIVDQYDPRNLAELSIVSSLADAIWRQRRLNNAANLEIQRQMNSLGYEPSDDLAMTIAVYLSAETSSPVIHRIEARVRHYTREIARLQRILIYMQKQSVSDEATQMSAEILDLAVKQREEEKLSAPPPPDKQPPQVENRPVEAQEQLRM